MCGETSGHTARAIAIAASDDAGSARAVPIGEPAYSNDSAWRARQPNIIYILCDDLGYGDVHALNPARGKIPTPNIDRMISQGMAFGDAHASSSVCTPSRYSLLTWRYNWRSTLQKGVLYGNDGPIIEPERMTVASLLQLQGYHTLALGKWHLGFSYGADQFHDPITNGPLQHGFDHFFGIAASLDMPPYAYIEDTRFPEPPTTLKTFIREGPASESFEAQDVLPTLVRRAQKFVHSHAADATGKPAAPFFLYLPLTSPHTPLVPTAEWVGKSKLGPYGDFVMETDWALGQIIKAVDDAKLTDATLIIFTSDNGCAPNADVVGLEAMGHFPQRAVSRIQGRHLGRRASRAVCGAMARCDSGRVALRFNDWAG